MAVKEIDLDGSDDCFDELRAEISTLMTCDHLNINRYRGSYLPNSTKSSKVSGMSKTALYLIAVIRLIAPLAIDCV